MPLILKVNPYEGSRHSSSPNNSALLLHCPILTAPQKLGHTQPPSFRRITSTASTHASFPVNWKRELHEYIQEMRVLVLFLVGSLLSEHINFTVFMNGPKVGPSRTQLFRVHATTMEAAIQITLQKE
ncbi:Gag protein [Phytophthora palmivora]|uniref:Gag protein n=1 Tax=Phytophthora palmivora TaxID=4796 RepID=A0A2P4X0F8_9STRA|nr:Gag protein [Phytophthora palmivora]